MREIRWPEEMKIPHEKCSCTACWYACGINRGIMESKRAWQEAQAGEYIKQAVDNGYSLKSDKPPLSALDEEKLKDILKEHLTLLYETYEQCERDYNSCAKAICSKFGTPPSGNKVSVGEIEKLKSIIKYQIDARGGRINPKDDFNGFINDIYGVLNG